MRQIVTRTCLATALVALSSAACVAPPPPPPGSVPVAAAEPPPRKKDEPATPVVPRKKGENLFVAAKWFQDEYGVAHQTARRLQQTNPEQAALIQKIAENGGADWIGDWTPNVGNWVEKRVTKVVKAGAFPLLLSYNIPKRDCGQYSAGGADK